MMNIEEITNKVDILLTDKGLSKDCGEQPARQLLLHLYTAIDIYRYMTQTEKDEAGRWYRVFKTSFSLRNFLKERKRHRERKNPPCTPLIRKGLLEKAQITLSPVAGSKSNIESRQHAFWDACLKFEPEYGRQLLLKFYCYWAEEVNGTGLMLWETKKSWSMRLRLKAWTKKSFEFDDKAAALRLERAKGKSTQKEPSPLCIAEREEANERLFRQIEENKKGAVSREEWLRMRKKSDEA